MFFPFKGGVLNLVQKKYYSVKKGRVPGIFDKWEDCLKQVKGYSGALYKSFSTYSDALEFLDETIENNSPKENLNKTVTAYVDGSYSDKYKKYSYGCIILSANEVIELSGSGNNENYLSMRNVAGELLGSIKSIEWAYENDYDSIIIHHDYDGIEKWANGTWKANKQGTKEYIDFINKFRNYLKINFKKVKAHSGDFYNEKADKLAKKALVYEKSTVEIFQTSKNKKLEIFNEIMDRNYANKNSINFIFNNYTLSESKLRKFVKEVWKLEGKKVKDIDSISLSFKNSTIAWTVQDINGISFDFTINF